MIDEAVKLASEPLAALQVEVHPYLDQTKVWRPRAAMASRALGYCRGARQGAGRRGALGARQDCVAGRAALDREEGGANNPSRAPRSANGSENLASLEFTLSDAEMAEIDRLKRPDSRVVSPPRRLKWDS